VITTAESLTIAKNLLEYKLQQAVQDEDDSSIVITQFIVNLQSGLIPVQFVHKTELTEFWTNYIRPNTTLTQFILRFMTEFRFLTGYTVADYETFIEVLSAACCYQGNESALDDTLTTRASPRQQIKTLLHDNPWAVAVIVISICGRPGKLKRGGVV